MLRLVFASLLTKGFRSHCCSNNLFFRHMQPNRVNIDVKETNGTKSVLPLLDVFLDN